MLQLLFGQVFGKIMTVAMIAAVGVITYMGWNQKNLQSKYLRLQGDNGVLERNIESLNITNSTNVETIKKLQESIANYEILNKDLQENLVASNGRIRVLQEKLNKHNLTDLAVKKPTLIEKRMQDATNKAFDNFFDFDTTSE